MAKKFEELQARMSAESRSRSRLKAVAILRDLRISDDQSAIRPAGASPISNPESSSSSPAASQD
jgi:hypothetical protein